MTPCALFIAAEEIAAVFAEISPCVLFKFWV